MTAASPVVELLLPRLVNALAEQPAVTLILDDFHLLREGRARESINWLIEHAPPTFRWCCRPEPNPTLPCLPCGPMVTSSSCGPTTCGSRPRRQIAS